MRSLVRPPRLVIVLLLSAALPAAAFGHPFQGEEPLPLMSSTTVADFDADGWPDLAGFAGGSIVMHHNDRAGGWIERGRLDVGAGVTSMACADVNGDDFPDLAFTRQDGLVREVGIAIGRKDHWEAPGRLALAEQPLDVAIADLNADGRLDLVIAGPASIAAYLGRGSGKFGPRIETAREVSETWPAVDLRVVDMNGDALPDAFLTPGGRQTWLEILPGEGDGRFGTSVHVEGFTGFYGSMAAPCDFDRDGWTDAVMGRGNRVVIAWNDRSGGLGFPERDTLGFGAYEIRPSVLVSDFDGDGYDDIVSAVTPEGEGYTARLAWYRGLGERHFEESRSPLLTRTRAEDMVRVIGAADLDRDGADDVLMDRWGNGLPFTVTALNHAKPETFRGWNWIPRLSHDIHAVKLEGGKRLELLEAVAGGFAHWTFDERGRLHAGERFALEGALVAVSDLDGDGRSDLVMGRDGGLEIVLMESSGPRTSQRFEDASLARPAELDGRAGTDLLVRDAAGAAFLLINDGAGRFTGIEGEGVFFGHPGDLDADGRDDLLAVRYGSCVGNCTPDTMVVHANRGEGRFERSAAFTYDGGPRSPTGIRVVDLEGDGPREIVALFGLADGHRLVIVRSDGRPALQLIAWEAAVGLTIEDFDLDGRLDIAYLGLRNEIDDFVLTICMATADGDFTVEHQKVGHGYGKLIAGDADGNGTTDLMATQRSPLGDVPGAAIAFNRTGATLRTVDTTPIAAAPARLALLGLSPNPARGEATLELAVATPGPVRLELFDVAGRRVHHQTVSLGAAGAHAIRFAPARSLPAGLYLVRAASGSQTAVARLAILR